jgi:hypothetical protein
MARTKNIATKTCTKTGKAFPATPEFFYRDKSQKDGLSPWSKEAERAYNKAYYKGLKAAKAPKKAAISDPKGAKAFEAALKPERVVRKSATPKVVAKKTSTAKRTRSTARSA